MTDSRHDAADERDACGTGFVADRQGRASHTILREGLEAVCHLEHRGAFSADGKTSDGAGVMTQIPYRLFEQEGEEEQASRSRLAVGCLFWPREDEERLEGREIVARQLERLDLRVLRWRSVPFDASVLGERAFQTRPAPEHVLVERPEAMADEAFGRALYLARRRIEQRLRDAGIDAAIPSFSHRTLVYKALVVPGLLDELYPDLADPAYETAVTVFHQRYSTNTRPSWERAQPLRYLAHNGEINTLLGNRNWMRAREPGLESPVWGAAIEELVPVIPEEVSDSMALDAVLELLVQSGRSLAQSIAMLVPPAWEQDETERVEEPEEVDGWRAFARYHAATTEPWDGPAALVVTDGDSALAKLDRNGLRPLRYWVTDERVIVGSEAGIVEVEEGAIREKGRLGPGEMMAVEFGESGRDARATKSGRDARATKSGRDARATKSGPEARATGAGTRLLEDADLRRRLAELKPWETWLERHACAARKIREAEAPALFDHELTRVQAAFGYGREHLEKVLEPMIFDAREPVGAMGDDAPLAVLSEEPQRLSSYFRQSFAQVTNPPIDSLRERSVMTLRTRVPLGGSFLADEEDGARFIEFDSPVMTSGELAWLEWSAGAAPAPPLKPGASEPPEVYRRLHGRVRRLDIRFDVRDGPEAMERALEALCRAAEAAVEQGARVLILSDRELDGYRAAIPSLLATSAVHHCLLRAGLRTRVSLVCDAGDVMQDHDVACLLGFGAQLVHPRIAYESVAALAQSPRDREREAMEIEQAQANYRAVLEKGLLKVMAKLGISAVASYRGAQSFEVLGLQSQLVDTYFAGAPSRIEGADLEDVATDLLGFHADAFDSEEEKARLQERGIYRFRRGGEYHAFNPRVFTQLHRAVKNEDQEAYRGYAEAVDERPPCTLRDLLEWGGGDGAQEVPLEEVEPAESIVQRFNTGAMSFGSLGREAHETLAVAMNRLGARSSSGEGGEEADRFRRYEEARPDRSEAEWHPAEYDLGSSAIKQVASGRFGVTPAYLRSAKQFEIKMAQGSKPGEGGQIPGHKVTVEIARTRRSTPGVTLISPPPHHDIYSIEDLAQLIYDLKRVNPEATVAVKLVSNTGVGTIAAGVAKGYADAIQISGHDGGTGASPLGSVKHAGLPWELGLAETQRALVAEGLRGRVRLRVDGGLKTGRDVAIAAMLGAEEFGFGTAALVAEGCVMARQCHADTCPVGIATQREELRAKFPGTPERVVNFMVFVAEHVRHVLAELGARRLDEVVGRTELLGRKAGLPERAERVDLGEVLRGVEADAGVARRCEQARNDRPEPGTPLDQQLADIVGDPATLVGDRQVTVEFGIDNGQRSVGARLAGEIARSGAQLGEGTIQAIFRGQAGQSFGAFCNAGMRLVLEGEAQDYVAKGMGGGQVVVRPPEESRLEAADQVAMGNTCAYGATGGRLFACGQAGERLGVRNSGATIVVEGCGDHGCEYMTGGTVVVLGEVGRNFAAGMSGGEAFVWDREGLLAEGGRHNPKMTDVVALGGEGERLRELLEDYAAQTGSRRARELLENWKSAAGEFRRVIPRDDETVQRAASGGAE